MMTVQDQSANQCKLKGSRTGLLGGCKWVGEWQVVDQVWERSMFGGSFNCHIQTHFPDQSSSPGRYEPMPMISQMFSSLQDIAHAIFGVVALVWREVHETALLNYGHNPIINHGLLTFLKAGHFDSRVAMIPAGNPLYQSRMVLRKFLEALFSEILKERCFLLTPLVVLPLFPTHGLNEAGKSQVFAIPRGSLRTAGILSVYLKAQKLSLV